LVHPLQKDLKPKRLSVMGEKNKPEGQRSKKSGFASELTSIGKKSVHKMRAGNDENGGKPRGDKNKKAERGAGGKKEGKDKEASEGRKHAIKKPNKSFKSKARFKRRK